LNKFFYFFILIIFISCSGEKKLITIQGETMGTYYKVTLQTDSNDESLKKEIDQFFIFFNQVFSTYISDSEISKINNSKNLTIKVTDTMKKMLELSFDISRKSHGYFDITVGPIVNAWGFGPKGKILKKPTDKELEELRKIVGFEKLSLKKNYLNKKVDNMYLDMSAIAKGFGVDELVKFLEYKGYSNLLVEIGGEVRSRGSKPDGSLWRVGIEGPDEKLGAKLSKVILLKDMALATSGNYRNYLKFGDLFFGHTIDPIKGAPANNQTISVSVLSEYCADADAWATAFMSMGAGPGLKLADQYNLLVYFQVKENNKLKVLTSRAFDKYISKIEGK